MALPVTAVQKPSSLDGQQNGKVAADRLVSVTTPGGTATLVTPAHRSWLALEDAARADGFTLNPYSTYRSYESQEKLFVARYTTKQIATTDRKVWNHTRYYKLPVVPVTAAPGTSNHGWGLALDLRCNGEQLTYENHPAVIWLKQHAATFGYSAEIQSEKWHWRYFAGDAIPTATLAYEQEDDMPLTDDDLKKVAKTVRSVLDEGTAKGQKNWAGTSVATLGSIQQLQVAVARLAAQPPGDVNVAALAAEMVDLMDDDLAAAVANELSRRLAN